GAAVGEAGEDEAAIARDARRVLDVAALAGEVERRAFVTLGQRDRLGRAVAVELPSVIGADDALVDVAVAVADQEVAAMGAAVVEHMDLAVVVADHDHGLAADLHGPVVARVLDLALVAHIGPDPAEDALHLQLEDLRVAVDAP